MNIKWHLMREGVNITEYQVTQPTHGINIPRFRQSYPVFLWTVMWSVHRRAIPVSATTPVVLSNSSGREYIIIYTHRGDACINLAHMATAGEWLLWIYLCMVLTHWSRDKMGAISQTIFSSTFFFNEYVWISIKIFWRLFPKVQLTIVPHWFR